MPEGTPAQVRRRLPCLALTPWTRTRPPYTLGRGSHTDPRTQTAMLFLRLVLKRASCLSRVKINTPASPPEAYPLPPTLGIEPGDSWCQLPTCLEGPCWSITAQHRGPTVAPAQVLVRRERKGTSHRVALILQAQGTLVLNLTMPVEEEAEGSKRRELYPKSLSSPPQGEDITPR